MGEVGERAQAKGRGFERGSVAWLLASIGLPALVVVGLLFLLIRFRGEIAAGVANLATLLPISYAFAAGMVASVNPCGVLMLPAYVSYQFGAGEAGVERRPATHKMARAVLLSLTMAFAFVLIFAVAGAIISAGGQWLLNVFPFAGIVVGLALAGLGGWLLITNRHLGLNAATRVHVRPRRNLGNAFLFGLAYAAASLGCTLPIFLVVVGGTLATTSLVQALGQFVSYALGMSAVVIVVMLAASLFEELVTNLLLRIVPFVERAGALFLLGAGLYLAYYWVFQAGFIL